MRLPKTTFPTSMLISIRASPTNPRDGISLFYLNTSSRTHYDERLCVSGGHFVRSGHPRTLDCPTLCCSSRPGRLERYAPEGGSYLYCAAGRHEATPSWSRGIQDVTGSAFGSAGGRGRRRRRRTASASFAFVPCPTKGNVSVKPTATALLLSPAPDSEFIAGSPPTVSAPVALFAFVARPASVIHRTSVIGTSAVRCA